MVTVISLTTCWLKKYPTDSTSLLMEQVVKMLVVMSQTAPACSDSVCAV